MLKNTSYTINYYFGHYLLLFCYTYLQSHNPFPTTNWIELKSNLSRGDWYYKRHLHSCVGQLSTSISLLQLMHTNPKYLISKPK